MKSQIQNKQKKNSGIVELLIPTLNKIIRNQNTCFVVIMNNHLKIISVHGVGDFFRKKLIMREQKLLWTKKLWGGCSKLED